MDVKIFFLRGLARHKKHWGDFPQELCRHLGVDCGFLEPPGIGEKRRESSPWKIEAMVDDMRRDFLQQRRTYNLIFSISLGGMITFNWLQRYFQDFQGAVIINSSLAGISPFYRRLQPQNYLPLLKAILYGGGVAEEIIVKRLVKNPRRQKEVLALWQEVAKSHPIKKSTLLRQLVAAMRYRHRGGVAAIPILLQASEEDLFVEKRCTQDIAAKFGLEYELCPNAGHDAPADNPEWLFQRYSQWYQESFLPGLGLEK